MLLLILEGFCHVEYAGSQCEVLDGKERCFHEDDFSMELCPPHVNAAFLTLAKGQWSCEPVRTFSVLFSSQPPASRVDFGLQFNNPETYCSATCQEGFDRLAWSAHDKAWCEKNPGNCPKLPTLIPVDQYVSKPFSKPLRAPMTCPKPTAHMPKVTVLMLTRGKETETLGNTLKSYAAHGFFEVPWCVLLHCVRCVEACAVTRRSTR
jgi:hypothetical protein